MSQQKVKSVIKISKLGQDRIALSFSYNPDFVQKVKTVKGHKWHPVEKYWSFLSGNDILDKFASLFEGERLDIDPSLRIEGKKTILLEDLRRRQEATNDIGISIWTNAGIYEFCSYMPPKWKDKRT